MSNLARFVAKLNNFMLTREEWEELQKAIQSEIKLVKRLESDNEKLRAALAAIKEENTGEFTPAQVAGTVLQEEDDRLRNLC